MMISTTRKVGVYSIGFHNPKPLHRLVLRTWAAADFISFRFYTDRAAAWQAIKPPDAHNIEIIEIDLEGFFAKFYRYLGYEDANDFIKNFSWLIRPEGFEFLGYYAAQMRPLLFKVDPLKVLYWGWIDNDVMIHAEALKQHIEGAKSLLLIYPPHTLFFEQFKLFSYVVNVAGAYSKMIAEYQELRQQPPCPLEAQVVVRLAFDSALSRDGISFDCLAVHWIYYDYLVQKHHPDGKAPCNFDVTLNPDLSIVGEAGQIPLCFIADTQVKSFTEIEAQTVETTLARKDSFTFQWASSVPAL